ncbi:hypothetical protein PLESTF_000291200 [Pleodorina starrii]|nr:hypothetical protein PLESTF_000291200 [Pleodorina starrii]
MQSEPVLVTSHGRMGLSCWSATRYCIAATLLVLVVGRMLLVPYSGAPSTGRADSITSDDKFLQDLPLPDYPPGLDLSARFALLFGSHGGGSEADPATHQRHHHQHHQQLQQQQQQTGPDGASSSAAVAARTTLGSASGSPSSASATRRTSPSRLVLLPDLHGDGPQALRALQLAGLVAQQPTADTSAPEAEAEAEAEAWRPSAWRWAGGDAVLVQLGDVVDRGPDSLALLGLMERLRVQARAAGGEVVQLLGNHELMNIFHDFRYVSPTELEALAEAGSVPPEWLGSEAEAEAEAGSAAAAAAAALAAAADGRRLAAGGGDAGLALGKEERRGGKDTRTRDAAEAAAAAEEEEEEMEDDKDVSLQVETAAVERGSAADRELLLIGGNHQETATAAATTTAATATAAAEGKVDAAAAIAENGTRAGVGPHRRQLHQQQQQQHQRDRQGQGQRQRQHQSLLSGLDIWRDALAAEAPLGRQIRQRALAAIVDAGGCRILAVHAGAFPWMLRAVEKLLEAGSGPGGEAAAAAAAAAASAAAGEEAEAEVEVEVVGSSGGMLHPEQYVAAWNAAVAAALRSCQGRSCRRQRSGQNGQDQYERARGALADMLLGGEGAVWSRRYMRSPPKEVCGEVAEVVRRLGVERVVVGHTVQQGGRVSSRCGGRLLMADVGLSRAIAGEMAVLHCSAGRLDVMYGSGQVERVAMS